MEKELESSEVDDKTRSRSKAFLEPSSEKIVQSEDAYESCDEREKLILDGGLAWLSVLGCFVAHFMIGGFDRNEGIYFLQFTEKFNMSAKLTTLPGTLVSSMRHFVGPVAAAMCKSLPHGVRTTALIGAIAMVVSCVLTAYTFNFYFLFFSRSVLEGFATGFLYSPSLICINMFFDERQSLAAGLGTSGVGIGSLCLVPLTQYLFDNYGYRTTFLVLAGIATSCFLVPLFSEPHIFSRTISDDWRKCVPTFDAAVISTLSLDLGASSSMPSLSVKSSRHRSSSAFSLSPPRTSMSRSSKVVMANLKLAQDTDIHNSVDKPLDVTPELELSVPSTRSDSAMDLPPKATKSDEESHFSLLGFFHFDLLLDPSFLFFCLGLALFGGSFKATVIFIAPLVTNRGHSESDAALVLSTIGVLDTVGRIGSGLMFDNVLLRQWRPIIYTCLIFAFAVIVFILPFCSGMWSFYLVSCVYGFFSGVIIAQKSVVVVDVVGADKMAHSFGLLICIQAIGFIIVPALLGAYWDSFGELDGGFYLAGGILILSILLMTASNVFLHYRNLKEAEQAEQTVD